MIMYFVEYLLQAKPEPNVCGAKRKAETSPAGAMELPITSLKKNKIEEWSCALCQVSATCERGLKEHLQGKKHKAKEKALRTQKMQQKNSSAPLPKKMKSGKLNRLAEARVTSGTELEVKVEEESIHINKSKDGSDLKTKDEQDLNNKKSDLPKKENWNAVNKKKNRLSTAGKVEKRPEARMKKFKFWCEMCQVGAFSEVVMGTHMKGKKHMSRIQKSKRHEAVPDKKTRTTTTTKLVASPEPTVKAATSPEPIEKTSDADAVEAAKKAIDVDAISSPVLFEKESDVTAAASPECAEKAGNVAAAASPEPANKASEVANAAALLWLLGRQVM